MVAAENVKAGQLVETSGGVVKVLNSNPTRGGAGTTWELCGYAEGEPTWRFIGDPGFEFDVLGPCVVCGHPTADRTRQRPGGRAHWRCEDGEDCAVRRNAKKKRPRPEAEVRADWRATH